MNDRLLSSGDVCEVAGVDPNILHQWCIRGLVHPVGARVGPGNHRRFTLMQCFAVAAGARYREEGAPPDRVMGVVRFLAGLTLERLEAAFEEGKTLPVPDTVWLRAAAEEGLPEGLWLPGRLIEPPFDDPSLTRGAAALMRRLDLPTIWADVQRQVARMARRPVPQGGRGRSRGLGGRKVKVKGAAR